MRFLFILLPLIFASITAYQLNLKLYGSEKERKLLSLYEGLIITLIGTLLFNARFFSVWFNIVLTLLLLGLLFLRLWSEDLFNDNEDLKIETIKNTFIIFIVGYLPILVFLTVFRYVPWYLQITLSLGISALLLFIVFNIQEYTSEKIYGFIDSFIAADWPKYIYLWIVTFIFVALFYLVRIPTDKVSEALNLTNNSAFLESIGLPYDTQNNFEQEEIFQIENESDTSIWNYYYDDDFVYIVTSSRSITLYDRSTYEPSDIIIEAPETIHDIIPYDGETYVTTHNGIYRIANNTLETIHTTSSLIGFFYDGGMLHYYRLNDGGTQYEIYQVTNGTVSLSDTILVSTLGNQDLTILSNTLFFKTISTLSPYGSPELVFEVFEGEKYYDAMTSTLYTGESDYQKYETYYTKENSDGLETYTIKGNHESIPYTFEGVQYFTRQPNTFKSEGEHILIMNNAFEINTLFTHSGIDKFTKWNDYESIISMYKVGEDGLEFVQKDKSDSSTILTIYKLYEEDVDMKLPFYSYFSINIFYLIIIVLFIPITNYSSKITVLGGKQSLTIKKGAE